MVDASAALAWERDPDRTRSVAVAICGAVPDDARLWLLGDRSGPMEETQRRRLRQALAV